MSEIAGIKILICQGTGGVSMGAKEVEAAFVKLLAEKGLSAEVGKRCDVIKTGCRGLCANDVLVDIITPEQGRITYDFVKPEEVEKIIDEHIVITGSLNFTDNADQQNNENVIIIDNADIARLYTQEFQRVWAAGHDPVAGKIKCK